MTTDRFTPSRSNGQSDVDVIVSLVSSASPMTVLTHSQMMAALQEGLTQPVTLERARNARARAETRMLREIGRTLEAVHGIGYRVAKAAEHKRMSGARKRRADRQMFRGVQLLKNVRWDELSDEQRKAHEAQLVIMSSLYENQRSFDRRLRRAEDAIMSIVRGNRKEDAA